jgi:hypothetical protein
MQGWLPLAANIGTPAKLKDAAFLPDLVEFLA